MFAGHDRRICPTVMIQPPAMMKKIPVDSCVPKKFQTDAKSLGGDGAVPDVDIAQEIREEALSSKPPGEFGPPATPEKIKLHFQQWRRKAAGEARNRRKVKDPRRRRRNGPNVGGLKRRALARARRRVIASTAAKS